MKTKVFPIHLQTETIQIAAFRLHSGCEEVSASSFAGCAQMYQLQLHCTRTNRLPFKCTSVPIVFSTVAKFHCTIGNDEPR